MGAPDDAAAGGAWARAAIDDTSTDDAKEEGPAAGARADAARMPEPRNDDGADARAARLCARLSAISRRCAVAAQLVGEGHCIWVHKKWARSVADVGASCVSRAKVAN